MYDFQHLNRLLEQFAQKSVAGCACCVAHQDEIVYEHYYGYADIASLRPVTADTVFRLASMTKIAIYTACMMLFERGAFLLNDPVSDYFPEYRHANKYVLRPDGTQEIVPAENPMQIKHIMSMSCGLPYGNIVPGLQEEGLPPTHRAMLSAERGLRQKGSFTLREEIRAVAEVPLAFEPGTHWMYGFGSELAAGLLEVLTGKDIEAALKELLFAPLGMTGTGMRFFGDIQNRLSTFYRREEDGSLHAAPSLFDEKHLPGKEHEFGCPRLFTTARDFSALGQMLANGGVYRGQRLMGRKTIDLMRQNQLNETQLKDFQDDYNAGYGYGLGVRTMLSRAQGNANVSEGEFGWTGGFGTWLSVDPTEEISVVYLHQMAPNMEQYHHLRVRAAAYGAL
jgi:CubicO group peptidase (beta-lactamase class C family)